MAEYVRRRYRSARFTAVVAVLGVLASVGLGRGDESVLDVDDAAAAAGRVITIPSNSISSKHVKDGSLLIKDLKQDDFSRKIGGVIQKLNAITEDEFAEQLVKHIDKATPLIAKTFVPSAEFESRAVDMFLKLDSAFRKHADTAFVGETELDSRTSDIFIKLDSALRKHADTAFVGETELDSKMSDIFIKLDSALRKHADTAFVGETELDSKMSDIFIKLDSALRKHADTAFVGESELESSMDALFKFSSGPRQTLDKHYMKVEIPDDMVVPAVGATSSSFDLTTVVKAPGGEPQTCPTVVEVSSFVRVCAAPSQGATTWSLTVTNTFDTPLFFTQSPVPGDPSVGKTIPVGGTAVIVTPDLALRTIQIAPTAGADVPVATLTVSGHRVNGDGDLRVSTQTMVARP